MVQVEFAGMDPPASVTELVVLVIVPPLHCGVTGVPEIVKLAGRTSVKLTPVRGVALLFVSVIVTVLVPPRTMLVGEYAFEPVSAGLIVSVLVASNKFETPGMFVPNEFAGIVLVRVPEMDNPARTETVIVQVVGVGGVTLAGMVPPVKVMEVDVVVIAPPQVVVGVPETDKPDGRVSVILTLV